MIGVGIRMKTEIILLGIIGLLLTGWSLNVLSTPVQPRIIINETNTYCNTELISSILNSTYVHINSKLQDNNNYIHNVNVRIEELNIKTVQFYPRTQRKCKRPIEYYTYGSSMQPFFYDGDEFYVEKVKFDDVELGDVIVFERIDNTGAIHAVVAKYDDFVLTAGYNNERIDERVYADEIKYRFCEEY